MKKLLQYFLVFIAILFVQNNLSAQEKRADYYTVPDKLINHLKGLNTQWNKAENIANISSSKLSESTSFEKHESLIKTHLQLVENSLRNKETTHLTPLQNQKRIAALDVLKKYWQTGVFPKNTKHTKQTPYFIDDYNTACAVGHIMRETDAQDLAATIATTCNYAYISEMPYQKEMAYWAYNSGFSVEELKWIQPAYGPQLIFIPAINKPSCGAADGTLEVEVIAGDWYWGQTPVEELLYAWDNGMEGTTLHNIEAGVYCLAVFDVPQPPEGEFIGSDPVLIMEKCFTVDNLSFSNITGEVTHETCPEAMDGSITLSISGENHTIKWYDSNWQELEGENSNTLSGLEGFPIYGIIYDGINENIFHAEITTGGGCKTYQTFGVQTQSEAPYIFISNSTIQEAACGTANGYAEVWLDPGVSLLWSDGSTQAIRDDLAAGEYTILATNQVGCTYELNFEMTEECPNPECETDWFEPTDFACSLKEYVTPNGTTIYEVAPSPFIADLETMYYDCEGNFLCSVGGYYPDDYTPENACWVNNALDTSTLTYVQTIQSCSNIFCNTEWFEASEMQCSLTEYVTIDGTTVFKTETSYIVADGTTNYYDCEGNLLCYTGGFTGQSFCEGIVDIDNLLFVQHIVNCPQACGVLDLSWSEELINNDCVCRVDLYQNNFGEYIVFADSDCNFIDDADSYYDCQGNWLCATNGELMPESYCENTFLDNLTFVENLHTCDYNLSCSGIAKYSVQVRVLLEGVFDGVGGMGTDLLDAGILPTSQPFSAAPWNYSGEEQFLPMNVNMVDWVMVCLRNADGDLIDKQAAFVNSDGDLVNASGGDCIVFPEANVFESYYISVHHNGHLSIMSSEAIPDETYYDFTTGQDKAMGLEPMKNVNGSWVMFGGDYDNNGIINNLDFNNWYANNAAVNQYLTIDVDGNGIVNNLDYNVWELNRSKVGLQNLDNNMGN